MTSLNTAAPTLEQTTTASDGMRHEQTIDTHEVQLTDYQDNVTATSSEAPAKDPDSLWRATQTLPNQDLKQVLSRSYQIGVYNWTNSPAGTTILGNSDAIVTLLSIPQIAEKMDFYRYFRCKGVRLTLRLNSTPWHYGTLVISSTVNNSHDWHNVDSSESTQYLNNRPLLLDASTQSAVDYDIHWKANTQWMDLPATTEHRLTFQIRVGVPLSMVGTSIQAAKLTLFANFIDPEVTLPKGQSATIQGESSKETEEAEEKSSLNSIVSSVSSVTGTAFELIESFSGVAEKLAPLVPFLMDKPSTLQPTSHAIILPGSDMAGFDGLDSGFKLGGHQQNTSGLSPGILSEELTNPSVYQLVRTPGAIEGFSFDTSTSGGDLLWNNVVAPGNSCPFVLADLGLTHVFSPTPLAWYSAPFKFWRGGIKYFFHFVSSSFITSRLRIVWIPPGIAPPASFADNESGDFISQVIEVTGTMDHCLTVPYISETLYKRVMDYELARYFTQGDFTDTYSMGRIAIYLATPIVSVDSSITPTVTALVWKSAAEDFQFSNFSGSMQQGADNAWSFGGSSVSISGETSIFDEFDVSFPSIVDCSTSFEAGIAKSEEYTDVATLGKRYSIRQLTGNGVGTYESTYSWDNGLIARSTTTFSNLTMQEWLTACFVNFRGAHRWKVMWYEGYNDSSVAAMVEGAYESDTTGRIAPANPSFFTSPKSNNWLEFDLPWNTRYPFFYRDTPSAVNGMATNVHLPVSESALTIVGRQADAFGDDFAMGVYQAPPLLTVSYQAALQKVPTKGRIELKS